ncbi:sugar phosphate isomerase/epimerase [Pseudokineococcus basanitobsidens]|uniref:Sugar phosphate isomerase/epimerase n=1 Tax=Pseudokineococcus basanitobsidens TaxID=1926649 RepID=A0ABU8RHI9_9ACTN
MSTSPTRATAPSRLSVQLYTVREALAEDLTGTLRRLADLGLEQVEPFAFTTFPGLAHGLVDAGLSAPTTHQHLVGEDEDSLDRVFAAAADLGIGTVVEPHVPAERWGTEEDVAAVAADLVAAARVAQRSGVRVGYHNHAHELESVLDGTPALEVLARHLEGSDVVLEVDTYWVAVGGHDPVALLPRLGDRVVALHVKDGPATTETKDQVAVGSGTLPVRAIVEAAPHALRVVELDDSRGDRFEAVAGSVRWLTEQGLA